MKSTVSHATIICSIMKKDLRLYSRNRVYLFLTTLSLVFFVLIFQILPDNVEETITLAISPPLQKMIAEGREALLARGITAGELEQLDPADVAWEEEGLRLVQLESGEQVKRVMQGELEVYRTTGGSLVLRDSENEGKPPQSRRLNPAVGIVFPQSFIADLAAGEKTTVTLYSDAAVPQEIKYTMQSLVREMAFQLAGRELPVELPDEETIILGTDRAGEQVSLRDKLLPLMAFFVLLMETFAMASLISTEVLQRTVTALLVTPLRIWHFLAAKTIFGTVLALSMGLAILALLGAFTLNNWLLVLATMLLGAALFTAVAMIVGAAGKDFIDQLLYAMLFTVPLMVPAAAVLFPGSAALWVKFLPSYPIINLLVNATIYNAGLRESAGAIGYALLWVVLLNVAALFILRRKVEML